MSKRIDKVNKLIKQTVSTLLLKEGYFEKDILVTVTQVKTAPNFNQTNVFISVIPEEKFDLVIKVLNKNIYDLQQKLNKKLVMKRVPKIIFRQETKTKEADRIEKLLDELKKQKKTDNIQTEE
ncbi:MAG: ribosome-binding factor A [Patescibacteria group bacterium]|nr:ribosome-binding factor A [Patescibacteria group bacterium]